MSGCCVETDRIENLISLGVVIGAGCKPCTNFWVNKTRENGCSEEDITKVISIVESLEKAETLRKSVGEEQVDKMKAACEIARETLGTTAKVSICSSNSCGVTQ